MRTTLPNRAEFYAQIRDRNANRWGTDRLRIVQAFGRDLRVKVRDMILELVQNAEDAGAQGLFFRLYENGLLVWNDGARFSDRDVESISGLLISTKDARSIGHFGIGFKSVLLVTRRPCVLSGSHAFRLEEALDPRPVDSTDALPTKAWDLFQAGKTVFWLPFASSHDAGRVSQVFDPNLAELLLFMHSLREIGWESPPVQADYTATPEVISQEEREKSQEIHIRFQQKGKKAEVSRWLRLDWEVEIPEPVIRELVARLESEGDNEGVCRWTRLSPDARQQTFSVAIYLDGKGKPCPVEGRAFARLPTGCRTDLKFHISGRFATTIDRDRLRTDDPLTRWALAETERLLSQMPERLKRLGRFTPPMWAIFPARKEVQDLFAPAVDALCKTLSEGAYFHGDDGEFHPQSDAYLAHSPDLYELLSNSDLREVTGNPEARWVHPELRGGEPREVVHSLGVPSVEAHHILRWLQNKEAVWFEAHSDEWLGRLYRYLAGHEGLRAMVKDVPVVRLHTRRCVRPGEALLPPERFPEALERYVRYLPLVNSSICQKKETAEALQRLGVKEFEVGRALDYFLQAMYGRESKPRPEENREHIRMLFALWNQGELSPRTLQGWSLVPILRTRTGTYVAPGEAYLPASLGGLKEVEEYFRLAGMGSFIDDGYAEEEDGERENWGKFLEALGVARLPRRVTDKFELPSWKVKEWVANRKPSERIPLHARRFRASPVQIAGFKEALEQLRTERDLNVIQAFCSVINALLEKSDLETDRLEYRFYYDDTWGDWHRLYVSPATWLSDLQTIPWLPDDKEVRSIPRQLFLPDLKPILGPGFSYVHEKVGIRRGSKLARLLGIRQEATTDDVLNYLVELSAQDNCDASAVKPIYEWLSRRPPNELSLIRQKFQPCALILIPDRGWFRTNEVCWRDRTGTVPEVSEHWPDLKSFFLDTLQIQENPHPNHLAYVLLGWAERESGPDLSRIRNLASALREHWDKLSADLQHRLKTEPCWPARVGNEIKWERASHMYLRDREHIARLFGDALSWWGLDGLEDLADKMGVPRGSSAQPNVRWTGSPQPDYALTHHLESIWPFVKRFAQPCDLPETAPEIQRVAKIEVCYQLGSRLSAPDTVPSHLHRDEWHLYLSEETGRHPHRYIGDALERELRIENLREFIKDVLEHTESPADLEETLQFWEREKDIGLRDLLPVAPPMQEKMVASEVQPFIRTDAEARYSQRVEPPPTETARRRDIGKSTTGQAPRGWQSSKADQIAEMAMVRAKQWWEERGYKVEDVSRDTELGYDLEVTKGNVQYFVEVKGTERGERISVTGNEWDVATEKGRQYGLQVITVPEGEVYLIWSPANVLATDANRRERTVVQVHYEIPFSAIARLAERDIF